MKLIPFNEKDLEERKEGIREDLINLLTEDEMKIYDRCVKNTQNIDKEFLDENKDIYLSTTKKVFEYAVKNYMSKGSLYMYLAMPLDVYIMGIMGYPNTLLQILKDEKRYAIMGGFAPTLELLDVQIENDKKFIKNCYNKVKKENINFSKLFAYMEDMPFMNDKFAKGLKEELEKVDKMSYEEYFDLNRIKFFKCKVQPDRIVIPISDISDPVMKEAYELIQKTYEADPIEDYKSSIMYVNIEEVRLKWQALLNQKYAEGEAKEYVRKSEEESLLHNILNGDSMELRDVNVQLMDKPNWDINDLCIMLAHMKGLDDSVLEMLKADKIDKKNTDEKIESLVKAKLKEGELLGPEVAHAPDIAPIMEKLLERKAAIAAVTESCKFENYTTHIYENINHIRDITAIVASGAIYWINLILNIIEYNCKAYRINVTSALHKAEDLKKTKAGQEILKLLNPNKEEMKN